MVVEKNIFNARCINNKYDDFGNHTGFKFKTRELNLVVGDWYEFRRVNDRVELYINGKHNIGTGNTFYLNRKVFSLFYFYDFFSTIEEQRDIKLNLILGS